jgi:predicted O-methyltransferase YrrM
LSILRRIIEKLPIFKRMSQVYFRRKRSVGSLEEKLKLAKSWSWKMTEFSNYYYALTPRNRKDLAFLISHIFNEPLEIVESYLAEIENDSTVNRILREFRNKNEQLRDSSMEIGRRIGWYAIVRIQKPRLVVETGVHHGVGALVINSALLMNRNEGYFGNYLGTDINPESGELITNTYSPFAEIVIGDSITTLQNLDKTIDIFINDSDHSSEYEGREYSVISNKLSKNAVILGDNCHASDSLRIFSAENNRHFVFFKEEPLNHFYLGAGIGISFRKN